MSHAASDSSSHSAMVLRECGICQSPIYPDETTTACPSCRLVYHAECWESNLGCAAYGCEQVNALVPAAQSVEPTTTDAEPSLVPGENLTETIPYSFLLLAAATVSLLVSPLTWGLPSLATLLGVGWRLWKRRDLRDRALLIAAGVCLLGLVAGICLSRFWWGRAYPRQIGRIPDLMG